MFSYGKCFALRQALFFDQQRQLWTLHTIMNTFESQTSNFNQQKSEDPSSFNRDHQITILFWEDQTIQIYDNLQGFTLWYVHCLGWVKKNI